MKNKQAKSIFSSLENFSSTPPPELWGKIEAQLDKPKKKKRPVVWWWVAAGLAAGLSLTTVLKFNSNQENKLELNIENNTNGVVLQNNSKQDSETNEIKRSSVIENGVVESQSTKANDINESNNDNLNSKKTSISSSNGNSVATTSVISPARTNSKKNAISSANGNSVATTSAISPVTTNSKKNAISLVNGNSVATTSVISPARTNSKKNAISLANGNSVGTTSVVSPAMTNSKNNTVPSANNNSVATTVSVAKNNAIIVNSYKKKNNQSNDVIINNSQSDAIAVTKKTLFNNSKTASTDVINNSNKKTNSSNQDNKNTQTATTAIAVTQNKVNTEKANYKAIIGNEKSSEIISNKTIANNSKSNDSLMVKKEMAQLNALAELDADKTEKKKTSEEVIDKWSLQVFAGVMSSDNFTKDKSLGNTVASKQSSGYGVKTNYKLNKKWAVSSGFKINELGQKIAGVSYYNISAFSAPTTGSIPQGNFDTSVSDPSKSNAIVLASSNENYLFATNSKVASGFETGNLTQNLRYFEMPIEISYAVLSKKKTNIIMNTGGFVGKLISNEMLLNGSSIGENNNVNEYVYGTLLSSTLQYEFYKKTKFFIEPGMNYYVNPLENQSFNQFQWVFNVGVNVSF